MKSLKITFLSLLLLASAASCKKEDESTVSTEDAADLIASSLGKSSYGYSSSAIEITEKTTQVNSQSEPCLFSLDTNVVKNFSGALATYNYNLNYAYQMYCNNSVPQHVICTMTSNGNLEQTRISASANATGTLTIAGLSTGSTSYTGTGTYVRSGTASSKVRAKNSYSYTLNMNLSDLSISKTDYTISSGSSSVSLDATTSSGKEFHFTGTLTYVDANTATLVLNGSTFTINIPTSETN